MKIGIFIPDVAPETGGSSSLLKTIAHEILNSSDGRDEYLFLYFGTKKGPLYKKNEGIKYLNLDFYKKKISFKQRFKNYIKRKLKWGVVSPSLFDMAAKDQSIDLFWFPFPGIYNISYPYIYTVWDLGHRSAPYFPEVSRSGWPWDGREAVYQKMVYKASYIVTGNEEGKKEILSNYLVPEKKIRIAPFPVASFCRGEEQKPAFDIPNDFFFYPAQFWPHKNHICIIEALVILREKFGLKPHVFLTGSDKGNGGYIKSKIKECGLERQISITGFLRDEELKWMYTHATGLIFASLMGPNNMPPIEGTYLNCPVIITDLDGHKEQLKDTALYFDGYKPEELAKNMRLLLTNPKQRIAIIKKEKKLAEQFDKVNYFSCIKQIVDEYALIRKTWGDDFIHL